MQKQNLNELYHFLLWSLFPKEQPVSSLGIETGKLLFSQGCKKLSDICKTCFITENINTQSEFCGHDKEGDHGKEQIVLKDKIQKAK